MFIYFRMTYSNFTGSKLNPSHPKDIKFLFPIIPIPPYPEEHFIREISLSEKFEPDKSALDIILELYYVFGHTRKSVPFFDDNGNFLLME